MQPQNFKSLVESATGARDPKAPQHGCKDVAHQARGHVIRRFRAELASENTTSTAAGQHNTVWKQKVSNALTVKVTQKQEYGDTSIIALTSALQEGW